jgi:hypothetical protein
VRDVGTTLQPSSSKKSTTAVLVRVGVAVAATPPVGVGVAVGWRVDVFVAVGSRVEVLVAVGPWVGVSVAVGTCVGELVLVAVGGASVGVMVAVGARVGVMVAVGARVGVFVGVGVGEGMVLSRILTTPFVATQGSGAAETPQIRLIPVSPAFTRSATRSTFVPSGAVSETFNMQVATSPASISAVGGARSLTTSRSGATVELAVRM